MLSWKSNDTFEKQLRTVLSFLWIGVLCVTVACGGGETQTDTPATSDPDAQTGTGTGNPGEGEAGLPLPSNYNDTECVSNKRFFVEQVWTPVLATRCMSCHNSMGQAKDSRLVLQDAYQTGFLDRNLETIEEVASYAKDGVPLI